MQVFFYESNTQDGRFHCRSFNNYVLRRDHTGTDFNNAYEKIRLRFAVSSTTSTSVHESDSTDFCCSKTVQIVKLLTGGSKIKVKQVHTHTSCAVVSAHLASPTE